MIELDIFPRFKDFMVLFGARHGETEAGLPHLRFRRISPGASGSAQQLRAGIGEILRMIFWSSHH